MGRKIGNAGNHLVDATGRDFTNARRGRITGRVWEQVGNMVWYVVGKMIENTVGKSVGNIVENRSGT